MELKPRILALSICAIAWSASPVYASSHTLSTDSKVTELDLLIDKALAADASRKAIFAQSQAVRETGIASSTLMDPKLKVGFGGLPVDSFQFDKDPMTNISVGLMQQFERGETLALQLKKANQQADGMQNQIAVRELDVANSITQLWLELGYQQKAADIIHQNQHLMEELANFIQTNYSIGKNEAQDLINAQLQVSKLDEKLQANDQMQRRIVSQLSEWLGSDWLENQKNVKATNTLSWQKLEANLARSAGAKHYTMLAKHPMVTMVDSLIETSRTQVDIAEQAFQPQFGVEVMYAYRQANGMNGKPASDLVSAYLTLDIPLFTENKQDKTYAAAQYQVGAAQSQRDLLLSQMNAKVNALLIDKTNLEQRLERYESTLLDQAKARTKAVERGYQNNTAQFNDVIAAASDELTLQLEMERLVTDLSIVSSNLASLLDGFEFDDHPVELNDSDILRAQR
ncbi:TolC family protein [Enterovibrio sp. ZSDZ35]|uniref:TolC family protein n=1 Tax=Enterovibrio qingdaonensis TaxID=2899818 RepID=A0ABT5QG69_9GAMM|nr:TolC family protein [Enterovibrio sp. ZSDZ35]MDD1779854.1 TolC family protein [Enterovibrio sp. ZSDZ35]